MGEETLNRMLGTMRDWLEKGEGSVTRSTKKAIADELDFMTDQQTQLQLDIRIDTAEGQDLDSIGKFFRISRLTGETDAALRARIKSYFQTYKNTGTIPAITNAVVLASGLDEADFDVTVIRPGLIQIETFVPIDGNVAGVIKGAAEGTKKAGVVLAMSANMDFDEGGVVVSGTESLSISSVNYWQEGSSLVDGDNIVL